MTSSPSLSSQPTVAAAPLWPLRDWDPVNGPKPESRLEMIVREMMLDRGNIKEIW